MSGIVIRDFAAADLPGSGRIALQLWGNEIPEMPEEFKPELYRYLPRYYYAPDSPFNLAAENGGGLCGFFLAALPGAVRCDALPETGSEAAQRGFADYRRYLDGNRQAEENAVRENELLLLLFASTVRGAGKRLLSEMEDRARSEKIASMLLWTDETCDFDYYFRNGFQEAGHFPSPCGLCGRTFETWLFRKAVTH